MLVAGTRLGPYEILSMRGAGGMGEVYRARDTRLERIVAIKVLPSTAVHLKDRFEREAKAVAALTHPHICTLYDVGHDEGTDYLVMEYLEGETLAERLARGALSLDHALKSALEILDALDRAHRSGISHRDLKPGNVMLTAGGVKLLDFGLAKLLPTPFSASEPASTITQPPITEAGTIVGTLRYMAPEQLQGANFDHRVDIWAFGCLLYEMLAGRAPFEAENHAALIAAILTAEPPPLNCSRLAPSDAIVRVLARCLAKNPDDRWQTAKDLRTELAWASAATSSRTARAPARRFIAVAGTIAGVLLIGIAVIIRLFSPAQTAVESSQFLVAPPEESQFRELAVSPDGRHIAFITTERNPFETRLWVRSLSDPQLRPVDGVVNPSSPFWSPDSQFLAFFSDQKLQRIKVGSHTPEIVATVHANRITGRPGGTWSRNGVILFADDDNVIRQVPASGGKPADVLVKTDKQQQLWPEFLSDANHFVYVVKEPGRAADGVYLAALQPAGSRKLAGVTSRVSVLPSDYLLYQQGNALVVRAIDTRKGTIGETTYTLATGIAADFIGYPRYGGSGSAVAWLSGKVSRLMWMDRHGKPLGRITEPGEDSAPELSPDDRRLAFIRREASTGITDVFVVDLATGEPRQLTFGPPSSTDPIWSPNGNLVAFYSEAGGGGIFKVAASGGRVEELFHTGRGGPIARFNSAHLCDWSVDDKFILFTTFDGLQAVSLDQKHRELVKISATPSMMDRCGKFAPDSTAVLSSSMSTGLRLFDFPPPERLSSLTPPAGQTTSTVRIYPDDRPPYTVTETFAAIQSERGVRNPRWRRDGRELFYVNVETGKLMAVPIERTHGKVTTGTPTALFDVPTVVMQGDGVRVEEPFSSSYAVASDGQRFVVKQPLNRGPDPAAVVVNWSALLKQ